MTYLPLLLAETDFWKDHFFGLDADERFVVILVVVSCVTAIIITLFCVALGVWNSVKNKQIEADLKQDMLDRGLSAEEIEQVIEARPKEGVDRWVDMWTKKKK